MMPFQNQNPNYYAQYMQPQQPYVNPYLQRMENLQQFQQSLQQPLVPTQMSGANQMSALGKMVDSIDVVKATDIPMDGNTYYFPKADGTEVYCKQWLQNGTTRILTFKPVFEDETNNTPSDDIKTQFGAFGEVLGAIQSDIRMLFDKVDKISKPTKAQKGGGELE